MIPADRVLLAGGDTLPKQIEQLLDQQRESWPALQAGESALAEVACKRLGSGSDQILVQANPGRRQSIQARVDPAAIDRRPCFLCAENMPVEERGLAFGDFGIFPNPCPILARHLTIASWQHRPQLLAGQVDHLFALAATLGPDMLVFYNGARCGASAPDHFHFQACSSQGLPLWSQLSAWAGRSGIFAHQSFGRRMLISQAADPMRARQQLEGIVSAWARLGQPDEEPLVNILADYRDGQYRCIVFPRAQHRPACFYAPEDTRLAISPAALEMAGLLVLADAAQLTRVDEQIARAIYQEVSLDSKTFAQLEALI